VIAFFPGGTAITLIAVSDGRPNDPGGIGSVEATTPRTATALQFAMALKRNQQELSLIETELATQLPSRSAACRGRSR
jgi:Mg-chelatase subunit ChlD